MAAKPTQPKASSTSWDKVGKWYHGIVGDEGHYYHQKIVIPGILNLLEIGHKVKSSLLDLACGQGVLARHLPDNVYYTGIDLSATLIKAAKGCDKNPGHEFIVGDVSKQFSLKKMTTLTLQSF